MPNDAMLLAVDELKFKWPTFRRMMAYLIGVSADNFGNVQILEYPGSHRIIHRPNRNKPHTWDVGHDGFTLYHKTGGLPDIVAYSLLIVRDRFQAREVGRVMKKVRQSDEYKKLMDRAETVAKASPATEIGLNLIKPAVGVVDGVLRELKDKVLDTMQGSKFFGPAEKAKMAISDTIDGGICKAEFDFHLFDGEADGESKLDMDEAVDALRKNDTLIGT